VISFVYSVTSLAVAKRSKQLHRLHRRAKMVDQKYSLSACDELKNFSQRNHDG
jgi:hypothetical protein